MKMRTKDFCDSKGVMTCLSNKLYLHTFHQHAKSRFHTMDILNSGPKVALIIASWASEFFLAALFLRVVILPSITQTNARFWKTVSSRTSEGKSLIFEDAYDRAVEFWIVVPVRRWAQQLWDLRNKVAANRQYMLLQAQRAYRTIPRHLRELQLPRGLIRSFIEGSGVIAETLIHGWRVAFRVRLVCIISVEAHH